MAAHFTPDPSSSNGIRIRAVTVAAQAAFAKTGKALHGNRYVLGSMASSSFPIGKMSMELHTLSCRF